MVENETIKSIKDRRSVRQFTDEPVSDEIVSVLLDAANKAPSAHNQQAWRFIIVKGDKKTALAELTARRAMDFPRPAQALLRMAARTITSAPVVVAVTNSGDLIRHGKELFAGAPTDIHDFFRTMEIQSSAAAVENLLVAATSLGIGSVWLGILFLVKDDVMEMLGEPKGEFMAVIPIGKATRETSGPQKRSLDVVTKELE
ncbi:MAG: nitroreductase family protein [Fibrobacteres bacterium]|nr:nitroreductase family protein [Fibrobacterota bacterium]